MIIYPADLCSTESCESRLLVFFIVLSG